MEDDDDCNCVPGQPEWMATFADLMSLLLCFFVLLLSFATLDIIEFKGLVGSIRHAFGVQYPDPGSHVGMKDSLITLYNKEKVARESPHNDKELRRKVRKLIEREQLAGAVEVTSGKDGVVVRVEGDMVFESGSHVITPASLVFLDEMSSIMRQFNYDVTVEGHTDDLQSKGVDAPSNWELSALRAVSAVEYMASAGGLNERRFSAKGYGSVKPLVPNLNLKSRKRNRRIEFVYHKVDPDPRGGPAGRTCGAVQVPPNND